MATHRSRAGSSTNFPMSSHVPPEAPRAGGLGARASPRTPRPSRSRWRRTGRRPRPAELEPMLPSVTPLECAVDLPAPPRRPPRRAGAAAAPAPLRRRRAPAARLAREPAAAPAFSAVTPRAARSRSPAAASGFSASKLFAIDVEEFAHDPELEEASIRFANGDDAGAEAGLMEVLGAAGRARRPRRDLADAVRPVPRHRPAGALRDRRHRFRRPLRPLGAAVVLACPKPSAACMRRRPPRAAAGRSRWPTGPARRPSARRRWRR